MDEMVWTSSSSDPNDNNNNNRTFPTQLKDPIKYYKLEIASQIEKGNQMRNDLKILKNNYSFLQEIHRNTVIEYEKLENDLLSQVESLKKSLQQKKTEQIDTQNIEPQKQQDELQICDDLITTEFFTHNKYINMSPDELLNELENGLSEMSADTVVENEVSQTTGDTANRGEAMNDVNESTLSATLHSDPQIVVFEVRDKKLCVKSGDQKDQLYQCPCCAFTSTKVKVIRKHFEQLHLYKISTKDKIKTRCHICHQKFKNIKTLATHLKTHQNTILIKTESQ